MKEKGCCTEEVSSSAIVTARAISKLHKSTGIGVLAAAVLLQLWSSEAYGRSRRRRKPERSQVAAAAAPAAQAAAAGVQAVLSN